MNSHRGLLHHTLIWVSDLKRSSRLYSEMFSYFGYELVHEDDSYQDWKRWDLDTPHEFTIAQVNEKNSDIEHVPGAVGHHHHLAFCAESREDVNRFYHEVLVPLEQEGLCVIQDPPCDCPEYNEGYYATFFLDPDGLKYEFVINPNHLRKKADREKHDRKG
jgi:glyoxylase I family protein